MSYCLNCSGSGEGLFDGTICLVCRGSGDDPDYQEEEDMVIDEESIEWFPHSVMPESLTTLLLWLDSDGEIVTGYWDTERKCYISNVTKQRINDVGAWASIQGPG